MTLAHRSPSHSQVLFKSARGPKRAWVADCKDVLTWWEETVGGHDNLTDHAVKVYDYCCGRRERDEQSAVVTRPHRSHININMASWLLYFVVFRYISKRFIYIPALERGY